MSAADSCQTVIKVSVAMITYNHERFIKQAIESVLMQQTDFEIELVVGEDCSTDGTRAIVRAYRDRYPEQIQLLLPEKNQGMMNNFVATLNMCRGQYVALLEGDDYWINPTKLQKQVNFLEHQRQCTVCFHNALIVYDGCIKDPHPYYAEQPQEMQSRKPKPMSTLEDILSGNFIQTCSVMFRAGILHELPDWYVDLPFGDWALHILNAHHGDMGYIDEILSTYRIHDGGAWSSQSILNRLCRSIEVSQVIRQYLKRDKHKKIMDKNISCWHNQIAWVLYMENDLQGAVSHAKKSLVIFPFHPETAKRLRFLFGVILKACFPRIHGLLSKGRIQPPGAPPWVH